MLFTRVPLSVEKYKFSQLAPDEGRASFYIENIWLFGWWVYLFYELSVGFILWLGFISWLGFICLCS